MAYGCVYQVSYAPAGSTYEIGDILVRPCVSPCVEVELTTPPNNGVILDPLSEDCLDYPPEGRAAGAARTSSTGVETKDGTLFKKAQ